MAWCGEWDALSLDPDDDEQICIHAFSTKKHIFYFIYLLCYSTNAYNITWLSKKNLLIIILPQKKILFNIKNK